MYKKNVNNQFCTLIVEDSEIFRDTISQVIRNHFTYILIEESNNGLEVLDIVRQYEPDIILMDIKLLGIDGITLTKNIKHGISGIVVVMLSNHDIPEYRQAAFKHGADCFISKGASSCMNDVIARLEGTISTKGIVLPH